MHPFIYIAGQKVNSWLFFVMISFVCAFGLTMIMRPKNFCLSRIQMTFFACLFFYSGYLGSKTLHIILYLHAYEKFLAHLFWNVWYVPGVASPGAHIFGFLAIYIYLRIIKKPFLEVIDYYAPFMALLIFWVRVGCLLHGCCLGSASSLPWATVFSYVGGDVTRHPTQAYEMIYALAIFITLLRFYPRLKHIRGAVFFSGYLTYLFMRFFNEFFRTDSPGVIWLLKLSHLGMIVGMLICGVGIYYTIFKRGRKEEFLKFLPSMVQTFLLCLMGIGFIILGLIAIF